MDKDTAEALYEEVQPMAHSFIVEEDGKHFLIVQGGEKFFKMTATIITEDEYDTYEEGQD
jgi:hypothetical protein